MEPGVQYLSIRYTERVAEAGGVSSVGSRGVLAAAYAGAPSYGVEIFEPATSAALMATLLVHDLRNGKAVANPEMHLQHPYEVWTGRRRPRRTSAASLRTALRATPRRSSGTRQGQPAETLRAFSWLSQGRLRRDG